MANLQDEILALTNPAPIFRDPENDSDDETRAKVADFYNADDTEDISLPSTLRQKTAIILGDTDRKYAGKKTSRKTLDAESSSGDSKEDDDDEDDDDTGMEDEDELEADRDQGGQNIDFTDDDDDSDDDEEFNENSRMFGAMDISVKKLKYGTKGVSVSGSENDADDFEDMEEEDDFSDKSDDDDDDDHNDDDDDDSSEDDDIDDDEDEESGGEDGIQKFSRAATDEVAKGQAAKQQLGLWDSLLEGRIKLQKAVVLVNQLPQTDTWPEYRKTSKAFAEEESKAQQALSHLLGSLVHLQDLLLHQNTETQDLVEPGNKQNHKKRPVVEDDDDEEIPSDSDVELESDRENSKSAAPVCKKRKLKFAEYPTFLKKRHESFQDFRDNTIQKWFDKTRLATGKLKSKSFSAFDQSALVQINQILADKEMLIKRTQLKRSVYRVLGIVPTKDQPETVPSGEGEEHITERENLKDYDTEIFDDDDFYHQMLRELIEKKTTDVNDPIALSRQWLEIQKLRSKTKKKIDTRASKGRKVRYDVHKKLVNFMAPVDTCDWSHEARDDLFKSLFGKRFSSATT